MYFGLFCRENHLWWLHYPRAMFILMIGTILPSVLVPPFQNLYNEVTLNDSNTGSQIEKKEPY